MKTLILSAFILTFFFWGTAFAQEPVFVEPLTSIGLQTSESAEGGLSSYINRLYQYGVGLGAILAVLIIIYGGFRYMTSEAVGQKSAGKEDIQRAILGLLLIMSPVIVFSILNTNILNLDFGLQRIGDALQSSRGSGGTPVDDNSCRIFSAGNTPITNAEDARCCSIQTRPAGPSCDVVVNESGGQVCNCFGELNSFEYWRTLPIIDAFGNDTGESCREQTTSSHQNITTCQRQEELLFGGGTSANNIAQTLSCLGDTYSPPRPEATWNSIQSLPLCSETRPENFVARKWRGVLDVFYITTADGTEATHTTRTIEILPEPSTDIAGQEAECTALTTPEALYERFNTQELRDEIGAESVSSIVIRQTFRACTDYRDNQS